MINVSMPKSECLMTTTIYSKCVTTNFYQYLSVKYYIYNYNSYNHKNQNDCLRPSVIFSSV